MSKGVYNDLRKIIFGHIWNKGYQPIKQVTLYLAKEDGGIGLINIMNKFQAMLVSSFFKFIFKGIYTICSRSLLHIYLH